MTRPPTTGRIENEQHIVADYSFRQKKKKLQAVKNHYSPRRRQKENFGQARMIFGLDPPPPPLPPKPPFRCPHQDKKGINLLLFQLGIHLHTHQDLKLKCSRVMGQKLRCGRPCTRDLPSTQKWLAQSHIASISSLTISCWHNPVNLE